MKPAYLFSEAVLFNMQGHIRNLFYHPNMLYIFPSGFEVPSMFNYINEENTIYYDNNEKLYNILKDIDLLFVTEALRLSYFKLTNDMIKDLERIHIYFIAHGITGYYKRRVKHTFLPWAREIIKKKNLHIITCCKFIYSYLKSITKNKKKFSHQIIKVNHIPQFSYNNILYNTVIPESELEYLHNSVVIFPTVPDVHCINAICDIIIVLNQHEVSKNIIIKLKPKANYPAHHPALHEFMLSWQRDLKESLNEREGIDLTFITITFDTNNVQFFHCDKVITIDGGTSFFEALTYNNKTFNIQQKNPHQAYQHIPGTYDKLLICNNMDEFKTKLELIKDEKYFDSDYEEEKNQIFKLQIGKRIAKEDDHVGWNNMVNKIIT